MSYYQHKDLKTGFLYAIPSFITGSSRLVDLWGIFDNYNSSDSEQEADAIALYSDWRITGQDLRDSVNDLADQNFSEQMTCSKCNCSASDISKKLDSPGSY